MDLNSKINSNYPRLTCNTHQRQIEFLYLKDDSKSNLACSKCNVEYKLDYSYIIDIDQLFQQQENTIIDNLPPCLSQELITQLNSQNIQNSNQNNLINEVEKHFEISTEAILSSIKEHKIKIINQINIIEDYRMSVIKTYNLISQKQELQKKIIQLSNNTEELDNYLKDIIQAMKSSLQQDNKKIQDSLLFHSNQTKKININSIKNNLLSILDKVKSTVFLQSNHVNSISNPTSFFQSPPPLPLPPPHLPPTQNCFIQQFEQNNQNTNNIIVPKQYYIQATKLSGPIIKPQIQQQSSPIINLIKEQMEIKSIQELKSRNNIKNYQNISIKLNSQSIENDQMKQISNCLQGCQNINQFSIQLSHNNLGNSGIGHLSIALQQFKLTHFTLHINGNKSIGELGISELTKSLQYQSNTITYLDLKLGNNENMTDQVIIQYIAPLISSYTKLSYLDLYLRETKIGGNTIKKIGNSLVGLSNLNTLTLYFSDNQIQDDDAFFQLSNYIFLLSQSLRKVTLYLNNNKINGQSALTLLQALQNCDDLEELRIDFFSNKIGESFKKQLKQIEQKIRNNSKKLKKITIDLD